MPARLPYRNRAGMSEREYAAHAGISRGAVQKARSSGRLVIHPDGSIDAAASDAWRAQATDPAKQRGRHASAARPVPREADEAVNMGQPELALPTSSAGAITYLQARTTNEVLKAQERRLRLQKLKGELVDRARAVDLVFRLARQERDAWAGWPTRVAASMAADLGVGTHAMQQVLEQHVRGHLEELADIRADFR
jgi:hypothetical protein